MAASMVKQDDDGLTEDVIDGLKLPEVLRLVKKYEISTGPAKTLEILKCFLKIHAAKDKRTTAHVTDMLLDMKSDDTRGRQTLRDIASRVQAHTRALVLDNEVIQRQLAKSIPEFDAEMSKHMDLLSTEKCPILILGETSAGKSSFINVFLGEDILPCSHLSNTSVICEISYGATRSARVYPYDNNEPIIELREEGSTGKDGTSEQQFYASLAGYIQDKERSSRWRYKKVEIFIPSEILKSGLFIVDSPGVGETQDMTDLVIDYMMQAFAFIYIINAMNAGGVQTDRLQAIMKALLEQRRNKEMSFSPQAAIFICNKWDQVPTCERDKVMKDTLYKLSGVWPAFSHTQVFVLSTREASVILKAGYIVGKFAKILDGLQEVTPTGLHDKLRFSYDWFEFFTKRTIHFLESYLTQSTKTKAERTKAIKEIEVRLQKMKLMSDEFFRARWRSFSKKKNEAITALKEFLRHEDTWKRVVTWTEADVPLGGTWRDVELTIRAKTHERVSIEVRNWEQTDGFFRKLRQNLVDDFRHNFMVIEKELDEVEKIMSGKEMEISLKEKRNKNDEGEYPSLIRQISAPIFSGKNKIAIGITAPILAPILLAGLIVSLPILGLMTIRKEIMSYQSKNKMREFQAEPVEFMQKYSSELVGQFLKDASLKEFVKAELHIVYEFLEHLQNVVPKQIDADILLVDLIRTEMRNASEIQTLYKPRLLDFQDLLRHLMWYKITHINRIDDSIVLTGIPDVSIHSLTINNDNVICSGLNATIVRGTFSHLSPGDGDDYKIKEVCVRELRVPLSPDVIEAFIEEEWVYRYARHRENFVKLLATTKHVPSVYQIFEYVSGPLRNYMAVKWKSHFGDHMERCRIIQSTATNLVEGLEFLHNRKLVHYDLSQDTLAVDSSGRLKLTNISCDRFLPVDEIVTSRPMDMSLTCLPLEVLLDESSRMKYTACSDMYSVGLIMWELWTGERAFEYEIRHVDSYVKTCSQFVIYLGSQSARPRMDQFRDTATVKNPELVEFANMWQAIMMKCWSSDCGMRHTSGQWLVAIRDSS